MGYIVFAACDCLVMGDISRGETKILVPELEVLSTILLSPAKASFPFSWERLLFSGAGEGGGSELAVNFILRCIG